MRAATLLLAAALALAGCGDAAPVRTVAVGGPAPAYRAADLEGAPVALEELRGGPVLLNVWATWCAPCREEMPALEALHRELAPRGLRVVAVSIDRRGAGGDIRRFAADLGLTFALLHDPEERVVGAFRTRGVPESFLIGADGTILHRWVGRFDPLEPASRARIEAAL